MTPNSSETLTVDQGTLHNSPEEMNFQNSRYLLRKSYETHLSTLRDKVQISLMLQQVVNIFTIVRETVLPLVQPILWCLLEIDC